MTSEQARALLCYRIERTRVAIQSSRDSIARSDNCIRGTLELLARCRNAFGASVVDGCQVSSRHESWRVAVERRAAARELRADRNGRFP